MKMIRRGYDFVPIFSFEDIMIDMDRCNNYKETVSLAHWSMNHKEITMNMLGFKWAFKNKIGYPLYRKLINSMSHEVIHGVIQKIMEQDKWSGSVNMEWPLENGMDSDYARVVKRLKQ